MFYLTFLLPEARRLLEQHGFGVTVHEGIFQGPWRILKVVEAIKYVA